MKKRIFNEVNRGKFLWIKILLSWWTGCVCAHDHYWQIAIYMKILKTSELNLNRDSVDKVCLHYNEKVSDRLWLDTLKNTSSESFDNEENMIFTNRVHYFHDTKKVVDVPWNFVVRYPLVIHQPHFGCRVKVMNFLWSLFVILQDWKTTSSSLW